MSDKSLIDRLSNVSFFSELNKEQLAVVSEHVELINLAPETTVFSEGDIGDSLYYIIKGSLGVVKDSDWGEDVKLATLSEGYSFGEMSLIDDFPRSASVVSQTDAIIIKLKKTDFDYIVDKHLEIGLVMLKKISKFLCRHVREANASLADFLEPI